MLSLGTASTVQAQSGGIESNCFLFTGDFIRLLCVNQSF